MMFRDISPSIKSVCKKICRTRSHKTHFAPLCLCLLVKAKLYMYSTAAGLTSRNFSIRPELMGSPAPKREAEAIHYRLDYATVVRPAAIFHDHRDVKVLILMQSTVRTVNFV